MKKEKKYPDPLQPFQSIGLCFSGGGYRATSFSLGVLDYLNKVQFEGAPLLEKVLAISSVSGGTITAATFATSNAKGESFEEFYEKLYQFLDEDKLLDLAFAKFMDVEYWKKTSRTRSLINSFAVTYHEQLVGETFEDLKREKLKGHLKYVCFNATEFSFGLAFRFQNVNTFGNYELGCRELTDVKKSIKVSDAIASSSCFPLGFDPMIFPNDYLEDHQSEEYKRLVNRPNFTQGIGIMDGGIVDNQGIGSMVYMDQSSLPEVPLNLLIVNDVGSFRMSPWVRDRKGGKSRSGSLANFIAHKLAYIQLRPIYWILLLAGILGLIGGSVLRQFYGVTWTLLYVISSILIGVGGVLTLLGAGGNILVKFLKEEFKQRFQEVIPKPILPKVEKISSLNLSLVKNMVTNRVTSAVLMINEVFFRQIRRLNFDLIYRAEEFDLRRVTTTVYQLNGESTNLSTEPEGENHIPVSKRIKEVALVASETPTTLWWDAKDREVNRLNKLIACGQFTTCYNLIKYIQELPLEYQSEEVKKLEKTLRADWNKLKEDPMVFVH